MMARVVRVGLFAIVVTAVALWAFERRAAARTEELLWGLGSEMMRYDDALYQDTPRSLLLNGQALQVASGTAARDFKTVLDVYAARCRDRDAGLGELLVALKRAERAAGRELEGAGTLIRDEGDASGFVACVDLGREEGGWLDRLSRYASSRDFVDLGAMRFVYAHESGDRTHFVAVWSEGSFSPDRMFPEEGDAPGFDPIGIPRAQGSRRVLSAQERDQAQNVAVYAFKNLDEAGVRQHYVRALAREGWAPLGPQEGSELLFEKNDRSVAVTLTRMGETTLATILVHEAGP